MRDHALKQAEEAPAEANTHRNRFFVGLALQRQGRSSSPWRRHTKRLAVGRERRAAPPAKRQAQAQAQQSQKEASPLGVLCRFATKNTKIIFFSVQAGSGQAIDGGCWQIMEDPFAPITAIVCRQEAWAALQTAQGEALRGRVGVRKLGLRVV